MAERLRVNPNRMELLKLKKRLGLAERGHDLLKDKLDELMKYFHVLMRECRSLRAGIEKDLGGAYDSFALARAEISNKELGESLLFPATETELKSERDYVMSVAVPRFELDSEGHYDCYGLATTPSSYDVALAGYSELLPRLISLAEKEKTLMLMAEEIESTRRRVNALEYVVIPQLEETIRYITMKLDEFERGYRTQLMKIKEMVMEVAGEGTQI